MRNAAVFNDAFLVCHEIYVAARELVNSRIATTQLQSASKFLWRPDLRPRLVEYVADFARAGERALGETEKTRTLKNALGVASRPSGQAGCGTRTSFSAGSSPYRGRSGAGQPSDASTPTAFFGSTAAGGRGRAGCPMPKGHDRPGAFGAAKAPRASRLILFRMYYLGGAEYEAARLLLDR